MNNRNLWYFEIIKLYLILTCNLMILHCLMQYFSPFQILCLTNIGKNIGTNKILIFSLALTVITAGIVVVERGTRIPNLDKIFTLFHDLLWVKPFIVLYQSVDAQGTYSPAICTPDRLLYLCTDRVAKFKKILGNIVSATPFYFKISNKRMTNLIFDCY